MVNAAGLDPVTLKSLLVQVQLPALIGVFMTIAILVLVFIYFCSMMEKLRL